jgi:hypothetical protein
MYTQKITRERRGSVTPFKGEKNEKESFSILDDCLQHGGIYSVSKSAITIPQVYDFPNNL